MRAELSCRRGPEHARRLRVRPLRQRLHAAGDLGGAQLVAGVRQDISPHNELASLCEPCQVWPSSHIASPVYRQHLPRLGRVRGWLLIRLLRRRPALLQVPCHPRAWGWGQAHGEGIILGA